MIVALTSDRSYRNAFEPKAALEIMIDEVADYDMKVFLAFQRVVHSGALGQEMCRIKTVKSWKQIEPLQLFEEEIKWLV